MTTITDQKLAELEALCEAATPGPWIIEPHGKSHALYAGRTAELHGLNLMYIGDGDGNFNANTKFIALCREAVPALLAECERLREGLRLAIMSDSDEVKALEADNAKLREALKPFADEAAQYVVNDDDPVPDDDDNAWDSDFTVGELLRARAAMGDKND